jgi:hypothetical protein
VGAALLEKALPSTLKSLFSGTRSFDSAELAKSGMEPSASHLKRMVVAASVSPRALTTTAVDTWRR